MAELIDRFSYEKESLTTAQLERAVGTVAAADYAAWFAELPKPLRDNVVEHWGDPPGGVYVHDGAIRLAGLDLGGVLVMVQPPRGFGENPIAIYHSPDLPPTHHYLAYYRWLERAGAPTRSSTSASTATWNGCRARASACRRPAGPTPPSATCRSSTPSSSTTPARAPRPSGGPTP